MRADRVRDRFAFVVVGFVVAAILLTFVAGLAFGFDPIALLIFGFIVATGALVIAITRKRAMATPAVCSECGGVISVHAAYCKHCGARR